MKVKFAGGIGVSAVTRVFGLGETVPLPKDTAIIEVPRLPNGSQSAENQTEIVNADGSKMTVGTVAQELSEKCSGCGVSSLTSVESDDIPPGTLLIASPSAASYFVIPDKLHSPLKVLLDGGTVGDALTACGSISPRKSRAMLQELLSHIEFRNFYDNVVPEEYVPDGAMLQVYVTNRCNLRCRHCYMKSGLPLAHGEAETKDRLKALELFAGIHPGGLVTFTGGEALLDPDIFILLKRARLLELKTELYSNGLTINHSNISTIVDLVDDLQISLDGATARAHEEIRGKRTFRRTLKTIRLLDRWAQDNSRFRYRISFTLTPSNWRDIQENLRPLLSRLNLQAVSRVQVGAGSGVGRASKNPKMYSAVEDMRRIESSVMHSLAKKGVFRLPIFLLNRFTKSCGHGATVAIGADGNIYPCNITDQPSIGNVREENAQDVMRSVRDYVKSSAVDKVDGCNRGSIRYFCGGICRITNFRMTGSFIKSACTPKYKHAQIRALVRRYESFLISAESYEDDVRQLS